jgi:hypothetical protein
MYRLNCDGHGLYSASLVTIRKGAMICGDVRQIAVPDRASGDRHWCTSAVFIWSSGRLKIAFVNQATILLLIIFNIGTYDMCVFVYSGQGSWFGSLIDTCEIVSRYGLLADRGHQGFLIYVHSFSLIRFPRMSNGCEVRWDLENEIHGKGDKARRRQRN